MKAVFITVILSFLSFPLLNDVLRVFPEKAPWGLRTARELPQLSITSISTRQFQKVAEERAKKESGLWLPLVQIGNDIYSRFFSQVTAFFNPSVLIGHDGHLFQPAHLREFNRQRTVPLKRFTTQVKALRDFSDAMRKENRSVLLVISPNLISLYPELVPSLYEDPTRLTRSSEYEVLLSLLDQHQVPYVDTFAILRDKKLQYPFRFFARSASHWNDVASCLALEAINKKLNEMGGARLRAFSCESWQMEPVPRQKDKDLLEIANVLTPERFLEPTPYVTVRFQEAQPEIKPRVLLVGTSYLFAIHNHLSRWDLAAESVFYFYFKSVKRNNSRILEPLRKSELDWQKVLSRDVIIINVGMSTPSAIGYGFLEQATAAINRRATTALKDSHLAPETRGS